MAERIKKSIPWFVVVLLLGLSMIIIFNSGNPAIQADTEFATSTATIGNATPTWLAVLEVPASATTSPTNVGSLVTFEGRVDDPNGDNWYLIICTSSAQISTTSNGTIPSCPDGTWATSSAADNATATATYTTLATDAENNAWYAWACDNSGNGSQRCAAVSQGTGGPASTDNYSPFAVNHRPTFTALGGTPTIDPGGTVGINASSTDSDSASADWVQLTVCWSGTTTVSGWGASGACASGGTLCAASSTANPTCNYTASSTLPDTTYDYYGYITDNHSFASSPATRSASFVVNNATPTVSSVKLNNDNDIDLTEATTFDVLLTATISDENSCNDLSSATGRAYRAASSSACTAQNDNFCYYNISCSIGPCGGNDDADATTSCSISFWYYADPTSASTHFASDVWIGWVQATDNNSSSSNATTSSVEMNSLLALDVDTGTIGYGLLFGGQKTDPLNVTSTLSGTGNTSLDILTTSTNMTGAGSIAVDYQRYSLTSYRAYGSGIKASTTDQEIELDLPKTTASTSQATSSIYWGIEILSGTSPGTYQGFTKYEAKLNETPWSWTCGDSVSFTYKGSAVTYNSTSSQGECWLDRNLGASRVATAYNDALAYGDLFQWGRLDDGHQATNSNTTTTLSNSNNPGHDNFISITVSPFDWLSPQNNNLWQGVLGINNPCPLGWRLPTSTEWNTEMVSWGSQDYNGAFASPLRLTTAGRRVLTGALSNQDTYGFYWSSTVSGSNIPRLTFWNASSTIINETGRAMGYSVRCIRD